MRSAFGARCFDWPPCSEGLALIDGAEGTAARESDPHLPLATPPAHRTTPRVHAPPLVCWLWPAGARRIYAALALCARPRPCVSSSSDSSDSFLVIAVCSWTRFDKTSISLWVGTFKTCSAR